jgi:hypothetical protein
MRIPYQQRRELLLHPQRLPAAPFGCTSAVSWQEATGQTETIDAGKAENSPVIFPPIAESAISLAIAKKIFLSHSG